MSESRIFVVGASAGGLETLRELVRGLPADFPAPICIVLHITPYTHSYLPDILGRAGPLPAVHPADRAPLRPGTIYAAPPDHHLLIGDGFVRVLQGAKENNSRPAIDPLFRTAAVSYGPRVVAVLLSGMLDDGTAGLQAVKACGGVAVVQDPADALYPQMPESAVQNVAVDHRLPLIAMPPLLASLARQPVPRNGAPAPTAALQFEAKIVEWDLEALQGADRPGKPSPFMCPNCKGNLWETDDGDGLHFRCRTGHAFSPLSLHASQADGLDAVFNEAFRALKEKLHLAQRLARRAREQRNARAAEHYEHEAAHVERYAQAVWEMLVNVRQVTPPAVAAPTDPGDGVPAANV